MKTAARILRWLGAALGLLIVVLLAGFGLLQTQAGQAWLAPWFWAVAARRRVLIFTWAMSLSV